MKLVDSTQVTTNTPEQPDDMHNAYEFDSPNEALPVIRDALSAKAGALHTLGDDAFSYETLVFLLGSTRYKATLVRDFVRDQKTGLFALKKEVFSYLELP